MRIAGVAEPEGDPEAVTITGVTQDEPLDGGGDGNTSPDRSRGRHRTSWQLRAQRSVRRVHRIPSRASDGKGGCTGRVKVGVLHDQRPGTTTVDPGVVVNSFGGS